MGEVISLAAYRDGVRVDGTTLCWQGLRHELAGHEVLPFAEAIFVADKTGKSTKAAGFRVWVEGNSVRLEGWDMGPMVLPRGAEARQLAVRLLAAERARRGAEGPVTA